MMIVTQAVLFSFFSLTSNHDIPQIPMLVYISLKKKINICIYYSLINQGNSGKSLFVFKKAKCAL